MLVLNIKDTEIFDEKNNEFIYIKAQTLELEHSLISISKWESKWHKSFLNSSKNDEEIIDYIKCMVVNSKKVDDRIFHFLSKEQIKLINGYIDNPMTATTFNEQQSNGKPGSKNIVTSELIYYWMTEYGIPFECQKWHINRLLTLIKICSIKNQPQKKMSKSTILNNNRALNEARRNRLKTRG